jgi:hypothetical protein
MYNTNEYLPILDWEMVIVGCMNGIDMIEDWRLLI